MRQSTSTRTGHIFTRSISVELVTEHIKSIFGIDPVPVRGCDRVHGIVMLSVLLMIFVYYNCMNKNDNPSSMIKYMIGL